MIKNVATRCHILRLKCTKFHFSWGSAPDPARGAHSTPRHPKLDLRCPTSKEKEVTGMKREKAGNREGWEAREERGKE